MKSVFLLCVATLVVAGCNSNPDVATNAEPKTESTSKPEVAPPTTSTAPTPSSSDEKKPEGQINPNRAYQLSDLAKRNVTLSGKPYELWLMDTENKRQEGMMWLTDKEVRDDQGMLFVFAGPQTDTKHGFWMHDTILPLDIIYLAPDRKVLNIQQGKPQDETSLPPAGTYQYVIELKQGQAKQLGIKPGTTIAIPNDIKATE